MALSPAAPRARDGCGYTGRGRVGTRGFRGSSPSNNPLSAVGSAVESGATLSPAFVFVLLGIVLGAAGFGWMRFRSRSAIEAEPG